MDALGVGPLLDKDESVADCVFESLKPLRVPEATELEILPDADKEGLWVPSEKELVSVTTEPRARRGANKNRHKMGRDTDVSLH